MCFAPLNSHESLEEEGLGRSVAWDNCKKQARPQILPSRRGWHWSPKLTSKPLPLLIPQCG